MRKFLSTYFGELMTSLFTSISQFLALQYSSIRRSLMRTVCNCCVCWTTLWCGWKEENQKQKQNGRRSFHKISSPECRSLSLSHSHILSLYLPRNASWYLWFWMLYSRSFSTKILFVDEFFHSHSKSQTNKSGFCMYLKMRDE